jgi:integrase
VFTALKINIKSEGGNMPNPNHPVKDSQTKVDPIKSIKDIKSIKKLLKNNLRDYAIFIIGVNTNLRASDLVNINVGHVQILKPGEVKAIYKNEI